MGCKDQITYVRLTPRRRAALEAMARREERKLADMIRECIRREALRQGVWKDNENTAN